MVWEVLSLLLLIVLAYLVYKKWDEGFLPNYSTSMRFAQSLGEVGRGPTLWQTHGQEQVEGFNDPQLGNLMHKLYTD